MATNLDLATELNAALKGFEQAKNQMSVGTITPETEKQVRLEKAADLVVKAIREIQ